ncbi:MAG: hypothetical protein EA411_05045 [Saprospirales bacterium]|nr:MAG: hypothetical protein EA411_05045 [Saprospirales bacterium]
MSHFLSTDAEGLGIAYYFFGDFRATMIFSVALGEEGSNRVEVIVDRLAACSAFLEGIAIKVILLKGFFRKLMVYSQNQLNIN